VDIKIDNALEDWSNFVNEHNVHLDD
jgi:hypothetical protein